MSGWLKKVKGLSQLHQPGGSLWYLTLIATFLRWHCSSKCTQRQPCPCPSPTPIPPHFHLLCLLHNLRQPNCAAQGKWSPGQEAQCQPGPFFEIACPAGLCTLACGEKGSFNDLLIQGHSCIALDSSLWHLFRWLIHTNLFIKLGCSYIFSPKPTFSFLSICKS